MEKLKQETDREMFKPISGKPFPLIVAHLIDYALGLDSVQALATKVVAGLIWYGLSPFPTGKIDRDEIDFDWHVNL